jgi:glycosyltransferase involved in cell wall biosynthesis
MHIVHLTASTFFGGPERQMLGLAQSLAPADTTTFLSFAENGRNRAFLTAAHRQSFEAIGLENDTPHLGAAIREIAEQLQRVQADILCCHGYKANLLGRRAAGAVRIPAVAISRGWTGESWRVRLYERIDRWHLRKMDHVVSVSEAQAVKVRGCGVPSEHVSVIRNAVDPERFTDPDPRYRAKLLRSFRQPRTCIIGAAGRLSPEKGFDVLVAAAELVVRDHPSVGFILFGEGVCRGKLMQQIQARGLVGSFVLSGFRADLDRFLPHLDLLVLPSYTEGLPNVVLEAFASSVPVVATAVGGTPEAVEDGVSGYLVPPGDASALAGRIGEAISSTERLREMGFQGRQRVFEQFTFPSQAGHYRELFERLVSSTPPSDDGAAEECTSSENTPPGTDAPGATEGTDLVSTGPTCES